MKKLLMVVIILLGLSLNACVMDGLGVTLPNLNGKSQAECKALLDPLGIKYEFKIHKQVYTNDNQYDKFYEYSNGYQAGSTISTSTYLYVYTTALNLTKNYLDQITIDFEYEGHDYTDDGVGVVTLSRAVDGDTAYFYDLSGDFIKVRYLGIDTPESTKQHEAWGSAASRFNASVLQKAKQIVLYQEEQKKDAYGRDLAFVFADGVLVNLYMIQEAYSNSTLSSSSRYFQVFTIASLEVCKTGRRFWGEIDPDFNYGN